MSYASDALNSAQLSSLTVAYTLLNDSKNYGSDAAGSGKTSGNSGSSSFDGPSSIISLSSASVKAATAIAAAAKPNAAAEVAALSDLEGGSASDFQALVQSYSKALFDTLDSSGNGYITQAEWVQYNVQDQLNSGLIVADAQGIADLTQKAEAQFAKLSGGSTQASLAQLTSYVQSTLGWQTLADAVGQLKFTSTGQVAAPDEATIVEDSNNQEATLYGNSASVTWAEQALAYNVNDSASRAFAKLDPTGTGQVTLDQFLATAKSEVASGATFVDALDPNNAKDPNGSETFEQLFYKVSGGQSSFTQSQLESYIQYNNDDAFGLGILGSPS